MAQKEIKVTKKFNFSAKNYESHATGPISAARKVAKLSAVSGKKPALAPSR